MIVKLHMVNGRKILAVCDRSLLGKKFESGNTQLDLTSSFFAGKEVQEHELFVLFKDAYTINAVGKKTISFFTRYALISKKKVLRVKGIPCAYVVFDI